MSAVRKGERRWELIEHTADMGLEAWGCDLEQLFLCAAEALRNLTLGEAPVESTKRCAVTLEAEEVQELLVAWLSEILYRLEVHHFCPAAFSLERISETALVGYIEGTDLAHWKGEVQREVKAVTWHRLQVQQAEGGWHARVYVDL